MYKKNIKLDYFHTFFRNFNLANGIWMVFLRIRKFSYIQIALVEVIFHLSSLLFEIPTGVIGDIFGRKVSRILGVLFYLAYLAIIILSDNFYIVSLGFILCGISYTFESGSGEALVYDTLKINHQEQQFMKVNGNKEVIMQSASFAALMVAGLIAEIKYEYVFIGTGVVFLFALVSILMMKEVPVEHQKRSIKEQFINQFVVSTKVVLQQKRLFMLIMIGALMLAPITTIFFFIQNRLFELEYSLPLITMILGFHALFAAIGGFYAQKLEKRFGEKNILFFIPLFIVSCFWLMNTGKFIIYPFIIVGFFDSIFYVVLSDYMNKMVESNVRATVLSFFGMAFSLVMVVIFYGVGVIAHFASLQMAFIALSIVVSVFYVLLLPVLNGTKQIM